MVGVGVSIYALLLHSGSIVTLDQAWVLSMITTLSARVVLIGVLLVGVTLTEVAIVTRTHQIVGVDGASAEVGRLVRLLTFPPVLAPLAN